MRLAVLCVGIALCLSACATRYYGITFINVGQIHITVKKIQWGEREFPQSPLGPDIELPVYAPPKSDFNVNGGWRIPEQATVTWIPEGASPITRVFEIREHVRNPNSFQSQFTWEFDGPTVRIFLTPVLLDDPLKKTLIVESIGTANAP
jgi:hypothetical protein